VVEWPIDPEWMDYKGKDSNLAILQAGNLFVFTMNNPVRWIDPWGLFAVENAVLLEYILEMNNGTITSASPSASGTERYRVQIGSTSSLLSYGRDIARYNEHMLANYRTLMLLFGLSREQATHQPGHRFSSPDTAAIAFALMHTSEMSDRNRARRGWVQPELEIAAFIYSVTTGFGRNRTTHYTFGNPWEGGAVTGHIVPNVVIGYIARTADPRRLSPFRSRAGFVHTHPDNSWQFSDADINIARGHYIGHSAMPVFTALMHNNTLEVRRFDNTMNRRNWGGIVIF